MAPVQQHLLKQENDQLQLTDFKLKESVDVKPCVKLEKVKEVIKREKNTKANSLVHVPKQNIKHEFDCVKLSDYTLREWSDDGIASRPFVKLERLKLSRKKVKKEIHKEEQGQNFKLDQIGLGKDCVREMIDKININPVVKLRRLTILESNKDQSSCKRADEEDSKAGASNETKEAKGHNDVSNPPSKARLLPQKERNHDVISNRCKFKCHQCGTIFDIFGTFRIHVKNAHNETMAKDKLTAFAVSTKFYTCKVCKQQLLCDVYLITEHLRICHKLTLAKYCKVYNCVALCRQRLSSNSNNFVQQFLKNNALITAELGNFCIFSCPSCAKAFFTFNTWNTHLKSCSTHGNFKSWMGKLLLSGVVTKIVVHKCKICSTLVLCDLYWLREHMRKNHKKNVFGYGTESKCKMLFRSRLVYKIPETAPLSEYVQDLCQFACKGCNQTFKSWTNLQAHAARVKEIACRTPSIKETLVKAVRHKCAICLKIMLCDRSLLATHVSKYHKMQLHEYISITAQKRSRCSKTNMDRIEK
jgi:hypothetical protein